MNKYLLGLLVIFAVTLYPHTSDSSQNQEVVVLSKSNLLVLSDEVNGDSVGAVMSRAKELDNTVMGKLGLNKKPLYLFLDTPGGSIQSGLELIEALRGLSRPVHTVVLFAASMGWQITQALDDRLILNNGTLMSHKAAGEIEGSFGGGDSQMDSRYKYWLNRIREMDEQTVKRTNGKQTMESYTHQYDHEMWLDGKQAVAQGYADRVVLVKCDSSLSGVTTKHVNFLGIDVQYDLDNCPLNSAPMNIKVNLPSGKTVTQEESEFIKTKFLGQFENKQRQAIPLRW